MHTSGENCSWAMDGIEPYLDGELDGEHLRRFESHLESCEPCRRELALARSVLGELRALPEIPCPPRLVDAAASRSAERFTPGAGRGSMAGRVRSWFGGWSVYLPRPAMAAVVLLIVAAVVFVVSQHQGRPTNGPEIALTEKEAELAKLDVMLAFAYVGKYTRKTEEIIAKDVIGERVMKPVGESVVDPIYPFPREH